jgi:hypothetical protein
LSPIWLERDPKGLFFNSYYSLMAARCLGVQWCPMLWKYLL